jgi:hypothetical protein
VSRPGPARPGPAGTPPQRRRASRLARRDRHALLHVDVFAWVCNVDGTWIATPAPVRRYLRHADAHEQMLRAVGPRQPRRGVRALPGSDDVPFLATTSR